MRNIRSSYGFTIVEIVIVITVISIISAVGIIGFGSWRESIAKAEVKSDLSNAASAMKNELNFNNAYPLSLPATYRSSKNVTVTHTGDASSFCIEGASTVIPSIRFFVNSTSQREPAEGTCAGGTTTPPVTPPMPGYKQIATGLFTTCAIASDDKAYCWGFGSSGNLGNNSTVDSATPVAVSQGDIPSGATIKSLSVGAAHACAIASDNKAYCWGSDAINVSLVPVAVSQGAMPSGATIKSIATGNNTTCVIASDNKLYCWGLNDYGQLGNGTTTSSATPVAVSQGAMPSGATIKQISAGNVHFICAIASDDKAYCWGRNNNRQLGNGGTTNSSVPVAVSQGAMPSGATVKQVSAGNAHACAIASDDKAYCWGTVNTLGNGSTTISATPVAVSQGAMPSGATIKSIATGVNSCVVTFDDKAYCWGATPVAVSQGAMPSGATIKSITVTYYTHTCLIVSDDKAYCWGSNSYGQLGNGTTTDASVPVRVNDAPQ